MYNFSYGKQKTLFLRHVSLTHGIIRPVATYDNETAATKELSRASQLMVAIELPNTSSRLLTLIGTKVTSRAGNGAFQEGEVLHQLLPYGQ